MIPTKLMAWYDQLTPDLLCHRQTPNSTGIVSKFFSKNMRPRTGLPFVIDSQVVNMDGKEVFQNGVKCTTV